MSARGRNRESVWTVRKVKVAIGDRKGAGGAARYSLEPGDSPLAFSPGGDGGDGPKPVAYWLGSEGALKQLGLRPGQAVEQEHLELALQGRSIDGGQVRRPGFIHQQVRDEDGGPQRTPEGKLIVEKKLGVVSYDMTFSAPKSVSVVWSQAGEEMRRKIERAMLESWNMATEHLIRSHDVVMQGRDGGDRKYGAAEGFAASASLHVTARRAANDPAPAPQLHVHGLLVGLERPDGGLAGINSQAIFGDAALEAGAYARALLAQRLSEMGFEIEAGVGRDGLYFEIKGVHKGLIEKMSGRSQEIEAAAESQGQDQERPLTNRQRAALAILTRMKKERGGNAEEIGNWWRALAEEFEFGPEAIAGLIGEPGYQVDPEVARKALAEAVEETMRSRGPTVTRAAARAIVMAAAPGRMTVAEAEAEIESLQARGALLPLAEGRVTVPSIRNEELKVVETLHRIAERPAQPLGAEAIAAGERYATEKLGGRGLDKKDQVRVIKELAEGAGWSILTGRAGTGKSPVLQAIAEAHRFEGWDVVACAIDWSTARDLADKIDAQPLSIRQVILQAKQGDLPIGRDTLILIEEAGKVGLEQWRELAQLVDATDARVLAVGHAGQIGAVELPGMFEEMVRHREVVKVSELREIRRHRRIGPDGKEEEIEWMKDLQVAIDEGKGDLAVKILQDNHAITFHATRSQAIEGMVEGWFKAQRDKGGDRAAMIVQGSNQDIDAVNSIAQERRLREGEIAGPSVSAPDSERRFYAGDRVVLRGAAYHFDRDVAGKRECQVENGTWGIVRAVDPERRRMRVEVREPGADPREVEIDLARPPRERDGAGEKFPEPFWRLGYALHPNPAQGLSIPSVNHLGGHWSQDQESSYVALSRQIEELHDHVDCEGFQGETMEEWVKEYARVISASRRREASIRFPEKPRWKISEAHAAGVRLPEEIDLGTEAPAVQGGMLEKRFDSLAAHRSVLGEERAAWIERAADRYDTVVGRMGDARLEAERAVAREAFERLNREGALRTLALQREREVVETEISRAARLAESARRSASRLRRRDSREERDALLEIADTQERLAAGDLEEREVLRDQERKLHRDGVHLDDWMREERDAASRYVALEREIFGRNRQGLEDEIEAVLHEPPENVLTRVGPAPEADDPARAEWEAVVTELEINRRIAEGEFPAVEQTPREQRELERRVEDLRRRGELEAGPEIKPELAPGQDLHLG
jgi:conjugative relaxase-like TrwC/TraI family protein